MNKLLLVPLLVFSCFAQEKAGDSAHYRSLWLGATFGPIFAKSSSNIYVDPSGTIQTVISQSPGLYAEGEVLLYRPGIELVSLGIGVSFFSTHTDYVIDQWDIWSGPYTKRFNLCISMVELPNVMVQIDPWFASRIHFHPFIEFGGSLSLITNARIDASMTTMTQQYDSTAAIRDEFKGCVIVPKIGLGIKAMTAPIQLTMGIMYGTSFGSMVKSDLPETAVLRQAMVNSDNPDYLFKSLLVYLKATYHLKIKIHQ